MGLVLREQRNEPMKKSTLFNVSGAILGIGAAVMLLQDNAPFSESKFQSQAHGAYVDCLINGYEKGGATEWRLLLKIPVNVFVILSYTISSVFCSLQKPSHYSGPGYYQL